MILAKYLLIIRLAKDKKSCESEYVFSNFPMRKKFTTYTTNKRYLATISRCVSFQLQISTKLFPTNTTNKWFLI